MNARTLAYNPILFLSQLFPHYQKISFRDNHLSRTWNHLFLSTSVSIQKEHSGVNQVLAVVTGCRGHGQGSW